MQVRSSVASIIDDNISNHKISFLMANIIGLVLAPTPLGLKLPIQNEIVTKDLEIFTLE
jgi:spore maturation protein SpmA